MNKHNFTLLLIVIISSIGQSQWNFQNSGTYENLYSTYFLDEDNGWITGAYGTILKTTNGGNNWQQISSGTSYSLSFVKFFNENEGILAGSGGTIKKSSDGGSTWYSISSGTNLRLLDGFFINENLGWIVGDNGIVVKTTNGGDSWSTQTYVTSDNLNCVQFFDENTGWATSELNGEIWKTTDGGEDWNYKYETPSDWNLHEIQFVNNNDGWAVGQWGLIVKSIDGGESWFQTNSGTGEAIFGLFFYDNHHGFGVGKDENIVRTTDGGSNWILDRSGPLFELYEIFFVDNNYGWAIGSSGTILYTDNWGGFPFEISPISIIHPGGGEILTNGSTYFIEWSSQNVVDVKIEYSTNSGVNWISIIDSIPSTGIYDWTVPSTFTTEGKVKISDITDPDIFDISDGNFTIQSSKVITVVSPNGGEILDGGSQYEIQWSSEDVEFVKLECSINNGASWDSIIDSIESTGVYLWTVANILTTQARIKVSDISLPSIYDVSDEPFRINYVVGIDENNPVTDYKLNQNFPNPFNPETTIEFSLAKGEFVNLDVYDILGNKVETLIDKELTAGKHEVMFDASKLSSGIYFYKISAGNYIESKKMILIK